MRVNPKMLNYLIGALSGNFREVLSKALHANKENKVKKAATLQEQYDHKSLGKIPFVPPQESIKPTFSLENQHFKPTIDNIHHHPQGDGVTVSLRVNLPLSLEELKTILKKNRHCLKEDGVVCDECDQEKFKVDKNEPQLKIELFGEDIEDEKEDIIGLVHKHTIPLETLISFGLVASKKGWQKSKKHAIKVIKAAVKEYVRGMVLSGQGYPRVPVMGFPEEPTPEQAEQIRAFLSYLKHTGSGLSTLNLNQVRYFGAPYFGNYNLGNPQLGYLLVKAWVKIMESDGEHIQDQWYDVLKRPNEYLNPTKWIVSEDSFDSSCDI